MCKFKHRSWRSWALETAHKIGECFEGDARCVERTKVPPSGAESSLDSARVNRMRLSVLGVTRVKSYGPKVSHLVLDLECRPK